MEDKTLISLLSADIVMENGVWRTNDLLVRHGTPQSVLDSFRVIGAAVLLHQEREAVVLAQGGLATVTHPSLASVMRQELIALGISSERIIVEEKTEKTIQQLLALQAMALQRHPKNIKILSNDWHLPRVQTMVETVADLTALRALKPQYVGAEEILLRSDEAAWRPRIEAVRARADVQRAIASERRGIEQLKAGTYKFG